MLIQEIDYGTPARDSEVEVTLEIDGHQVTVPKGTSSGRTLRLKGKGFHKKGGERGDQLVTLQVQIPADDAALAQFVAGWTGAGNPRSALGV